MRERGVSLVSLLVGVAISLLAVVVMLGVYRSTTRQTATVSVDTRVDTEKMSALLTIHQALSTAGYGIDSPVIGRDLLLLDDATLVGPVLAGTPSTGEGNALVWGQNIGSGYECSGFIIRDKDVVYLPPVKCVSVAALPQWTTTNTLVSALSNFTANILYNKASCKVMGSSITGSTSIKISIANSYVQDTLSTTCLGNFK